MVFKARSGVLLTEVCGEYILVAARSARHFCPFVTVLNESSAFIWKYLVDGASLADLESAVSEEYEIDEPVKVRSLLMDLLEKLETNGYLLRMEQGGEHEE